MPVNLDTVADEKTLKKSFLQKDSMIQALRTQSPENVYIWIEDNVTDLNTAKDVLKRLAAAVAYLLQKDENEN